MARSNRRVTEWGHQQVPYAPVLRAGGFVSPLRNGSSLGANSAPATAYLSACLKSSIKSAASSNPTDILTVPGTTPAAFNSASDMR